MQIGKLFNEQELIGIIINSRISTASINLTVTENLRHTRVGTYVLVKESEVALFGFISNMGVQSGLPTCSIELLATIDLRLGKVENGTAISPSINSNVYLANPELARDIVSKSNNDGGYELKLILGRLPHNRETILQFTPERLFGRHLAIIGTSGSGKSWSVARIVGECSRMPSSKTILFDATGEYYTLSQDVKHVQLGKSEEFEVAANTMLVSLPYYHLNETDLFGIFNPQGQSQAANLRAAIESLKLARLADYLAPDGTIIKAYRSKLDFQNESIRFRKQLEDPRALFDITLLPQQIRHECVAPQQSPTEPMFWGAHNSVDYSYCVPMINRIQDIITSPSLSPIFAPGKDRSLLDEINLFLKDDRYRVLRISLKYLSFAYGTREILVNAVGRFLMSAARLGKFKKNPVLVLIDEAHQFLNNKVVTDQDIYALDSFSLIAKEGRKYALNVCIATQRPRDIPEDVLSQMGTILVHRLINDNDRHIVERACGELDARTASAIPVMSSGEAALIGVDFPIPVYLKVEPPKEKPDSAGPDYQNNWNRQNLF
jgi:uncharacterized protein